MAVNSKDPESERLAAEVAEPTGETKTPVERRRGLRAFLQEETWPHVPSEIRGGRMTKAEREEILGIGSGGV